MPKSWKSRMEPWRVGMLHELIPHLPAANKIFGMPVTLVSIS